MKDNQIVMVEGNSMTVAQWRIRQRIIRWIFGIILLLGLIFGIHVGISAKHTQALAEQRRPLCKGIDLSVRPITDKQTRAFLWCEGEHEDNDWEPQEAVRATEDAELPAQCEEARRELKTAEADSGDYWYARGFVDNYCTGTPIDRQGETK